MADTQTLTCGDLRIMLSASTIEEAEAALKDERYPLGPPSRCVTFGVVKVETMRDDVGVWRRYLYEPGRGATASEHKALCHDGQLFLIVGRIVVCLNLATGAINWACEGDNSTCFGLYRTPGNEALIVHGELEIARISWTGDVEWRIGGQDIFTGPFQVERDAIYATDWNGDIYRIAYETGHSAIIGHGKPFPH